ncbi:response regulator [Sphingomonas ginkgonis]|uniref:Response regulator n=1 Tax=Sphingomonas ginkgonis TaxID=2315330 RepID=A0A429V6X5_9SPHN|nr:response regulator [Sphingomonas ginkgonis]RST29669.1 response regulator [Sphingomonas ginkgonis]
MDQPVYSAAAPRILIVDSSRNNLAVLARRLGAEGYRVMVAETATTALGELQRVPVDLLIADLALPLMSGTELTRVVRRELAWRDLPVILISGRSEADGVVRALAAGADDVVVKPFHFEVLTARIARLLERSTRVRQLAADNATLDERVVRRAIELGEARDRLKALEAELGRVG